MRKFHWISMVLLAAPFAFANACGGDDTAAPGGGAGTSTGSSGAGGDGTAGTSSTGGSSGSATGTGGSGGSASTGGSAGTGGSGTGGMAGTAAPDGGGGGSASKDAAAETASSDDGSSTKCTTANDPGLGKSCLDLCNGYFKNCKALAETASKYTDQAACVADCKTLAQPALCCRANHAVTLSDIATPTPDQLTTHCPHIIGTMLCP